MLSAELTKVKTNSVTSCRSHVIHVVVALKVHAAPKAVSDSRRLSIARTCRGRLLMLVSVHMCKAMSPKRTICLPVAVYHSLSLSAFVRVCGQLQITPFWKAIGQWAVLSSCEFRFPEGASDCRGGALFVTRGLFCTVSCPEVQGAPLKP